MEDHLALYLRQIGEIPVMSREQERRCAERAAAGDRQAREDLARANLRFVVQVAKQHRYLGLPLPDLINEGNIGLLKAIDRYNAGRGFRFITYAAWWIRQAMLRASRRRADDRQRAPISLNAPTDDEESGASLLDLVADTRSESPADAALDGVLADDIERVLGELPPMEANVIRGRFGLGANRRASLAELGRRYRLTKERIRQIEMAGLRRLRRSEACEKLLA